MTGGDKSPRPELLQHGIIVYVSASAQQHTTNLEIRRYQ